LKYSSTKTDSCAIVSDHFNQSVENIMAKRKRTQPSKSELDHLFELFAHPDRKQVAEKDARHLIDQYPNHPFAWKVLGILLKQRAEYDEAITVFKHAQLLAPNDAEIANNLGNIWKALGQITEAQNAYEQTIALNPQLFQAYYNLGTLAQTTGDLSRAQAYYTAALSIAPQCAENHMALSQVFASQGMIDQAITSMQQALTLQPNQLAWREQLAGWLVQQQQWATALPHYQQIVHDAPDHYQAHTDLAILYAQQGHEQAAWHHYQQALTLNPTYAVAHTNIANLFLSKGDFDQALHHARQAIICQPDFAEAYCNLGHILYESGQIEASVNCLQDAIRLKPDFALAHNNLGRALKDLQRIDEALSHYRQALSLKPDYQVAFSNYLFALAYSGYGDPQYLRKEAETWSQHSTLTHLSKPVPHHRSERHSRHPLKIGILSAELGFHPVAWFLLSWLPYLDQTHWQLYFYPTTTHNEEQTKPFRDLTPYWLPITSLSDEEAIQRLRADQIDVLIETSGHTYGHRLGVVASRVATVQAHYIGYFATTGLKTMDYFIADSVLIPPEHDDHFTETVWRLPRSRYAYQVPDQAPEPLWCPDSQGRICLASFNNLTKVTDATLALWAKVLHALPAAYLLLKDRKADDPAIQKRIIDTLHHYGIAIDRIQFVGHVASWSEHMALYHRVDIALDTLPFNSATTGFEALWMGVPLVTLIGDRCAGRQAASLLAGLGRHEWIAPTVNDYVKKVVELATAIELRSQLRYTQRQEMRCSELCDGQGLANILSDHFLRMLEQQQNS
jgi:predicted O-linked N-acetylglucosamine transferase (SPINDLY family)